MIIETRGDVVRLSGSLTKNQWLTIRAAAGMLLRDHPQGIIVDCAQLQEITEEGAKTFLEAMRDIEAARTRIIVVNLPDRVLSVLRSVPGVRSQLPIADSVETARESLRLHRTAAPQAATAGTSGKGVALILVPLMAEVDLTYGADLAARLARVARAEVRLVYLLEVTRTMPLNAPLVEQEQEAQTVLADAARLVRPHNVAAIQHVERVRDAIDGTLATARLYGAAQIVVGTASHRAEHEGADRFDALVDMLLHRAPCEVVIGRKRQTVDIKR